MKTHLLINSTKKEPVQDIVSNTILGQKFILLTKIPQSNQEDLKLFTRSIVIANMKKITLKRALIKLID